MYLPRYKVALVREGSRQVPTRTISSPADAFVMLQTEIGQADREMFVILLLDTRHRVIGLHPVSVGSLNASLVHPRETFKAAFLANAASIILAHGHPSGDLEPSREDIALTNRLQQAGELLGVPVLDHLIVSDTTYLSLKERGYLS